MVMGTSKTKPDVFLYLDIPPQRILSDPKINVWEKEDVWSAYKKSNPVIFYLHFLKTILLFHFQMSPLEVSRVIKARAQYAMITGVWAKYTSLKKPSDYISLSLHLETKMNNVYTYSTVIQPVFNQSAFNQYSISTVYCNDSVFLLLLLWVVLMCLCSDSKSLWKSSHPYTLM